MNFLKALQHAFIGYGIRRKLWADGMTLYWDPDYGNGGALRWLQYKEANNSYCPNNPSLCYDWFATDWEVI